MPPPRPASRYTARTSSSIPESLRHVLSRIYTEVAEGEPEAMRANRTTKAVSVQFFATSESTAATKLRAAARILRAEGIAFELGGLYGMKQHERGSLRIPVDQWHGHEDDSESTVATYEDTLTTAARIIHRAGKKGISNSKLEEALEHVDPDAVVSPGAMGMSLRELGMVQDPAERRWYYLPVAPASVRRHHFGWGGGPE